MSLVKDTEELIEMTKLEGKLVDVVLCNGGKENGTLHIISDHGILIKNDTGYFLFPWSNIKWVLNPTGEKTEENELVREENFPGEHLILKDKNYLRSMVIAEKTRKELRDNDSDYTVTWEGEEEITIEYDGSEVARIHPLSKKLEVDDSDYIDDMKDIAEEFDLEVVRTYE